MQIKSNINTVADINSNSSDQRLDSMREWLDKDLELTVEKLLPASADASFRRYFRAHVQGDTYVVMDAPPTQEPLDAFIRSGQALIRQGVHAPRIFAQNLQNGFLLLEDLGNITYLDELSRNAACAETLYNGAIQSLIACQAGVDEQADVELDAYSEAKLDQEMELFNDWFLGRHLGLSINNEQSSVWHTTKQNLIKTCLEQPTVWVHRDYHSRNLMVTEDGHPGVIDFQDMVIGPISYDLASIFKDCYIRWPREQQLVWLEAYRGQAEKKLKLSIELAQLVRWYDLTGLQRHLKVLGIFCRLYYRDGKSNYLSDLPMVADYVVEVLTLYPELDSFKQAFGEFIEGAQTGFETT